MLMKLVYPLPRRSPDHTLGASTNAPRKSETTNKHKTRKEVVLVHIQNRFRVMSYSRRHEASNLCTYALDRRAQTA